MRAIFDDVARVGDFMVPRPCCLFGVIELEL